MRLFLLFLLFLPACFGQEDENNVSSPTDAPVAVDDSAVMEENSSVVIDLLSNDSDADTPLSELTIEIMNPPEDGSVVAAGFGSWEYTPAAGWFGVDRFYYELHDSDGNVSSPARVLVTVNEASDPPFAGDDSAETDEDVLVDIAVLSNDSDPDGSLSNAMVAVIDPATNGIAAATGTGSIQYLPDVGWFGNDSFTYQVEDEAGVFSNIATVSVTVNEVVEAPGLEDLGGSWVGVLMESGADPVCSFMSYDGFGLPLQWVGKEDDYDLSRNATGTSLRDGADIFTVDWNIPSLFFRLELIGTLDSPKTTFSGTWKFWDTYADATNSARNGTFTYALSVGSMSRDVSDLAGSWSGTWTFPDHGTANVDFILDSSGALTSGGFDGLRSQGAMAFVRGTSAVVDSDTGQFTTTVSDAAQEYGASEFIQLEGVLPEAGSTWTGTVHHYFWGSGTFQLQRP